MQAMRDGNECLEKRKNATFFDAEKFRHPCRSCGIRF